jgi:hypothetical protein
MDRLIQKIKKVQKLEGIKMPEQNAGTKLVAQTLSMLLYQSNFHYIIRI